MFVWILLRAFLFCGGSRRLDCFWGPERPHQYEDPTAHHVWNAPFYWALQPEPGTLVFILSYTMLYCTIL